MSTLSDATDLFQQGRAHEAESVCLRGLERSPNDSAILSLLAEILTVMGRHADAAGPLSRLVELRPRDPAAHRRHAAALLALGEAGEAAASLRIAIALEPGNFRGHNNLGQALSALGQGPEAILCFREALRLNPDYAIGYNNLGLALTAAGDPADAIHCFQRALALQPSLTAAAINLGVALDHTDQLVESVSAFERALQVTKDSVDAWIGRGAALAKLGRYTRALDSFDAALTLRPDHGEALLQKAAVLLSLERSADSLAAAEDALRSSPNSVAACNARAAALRRLGRRAEALDSLRRATALDPGYVDAWSNCATLLHELGRDDDAIAACRRAVELDPSGVPVRARLLARLIPSIPDSAEQALRARGEFDLHLQELQAWLTTRTLSARDALSLAQQQFFYLSYQERSNRPILEAYRGAGARRLAEAGILDSPNRPRPGARVPPRCQLGFVSAHVYDHSVYQAILKGWLQRLNSERFEISVFYVGMRHDQLTMAARDAVAHFDAGPRSTADWARAIAARDLDVLIYPEVGMNETTLGLAPLRLAERQFVAWGHPETSGLPTMDGYLSAELLEPPEAQAHYTEPLMRLPNLGVYCEPYGITPDPIDLGRLGVQGRPLFVCPGVPFKYRPEDDGVFADIAQRLGRCHFIFFQYEIAELSDKLRRRIGAAFRSVDLDPDHYLRFIPWQPRAAFFGLLRQADVYLDTIGFSGFNTLMQAVECNLPCVTSDGRFMRGRLGSGVLRRLQLDECIATDTAHYVELAVKLAENADYRTEIRAKMRAAERRLYGDSSAIVALENCLLDA